ncbi:uncharacterized protein V6R79_020825 [Siganus canaliculatus]
MQRCTSLCQGIKRLKSKFLRQTVAPWVLLDKNTTIDTTILFCSTGGKHRLSESLLKPEQQLMNPGSSESVGANKQSRYQLQQTHGGN